MELYVLTPGQSEATPVRAEDDWTVGRLRQHFIDGQGRQGVDANPTKVQLFRVDGLLPDSHEVQALKTGDTSVLGGLTMYEMSSPEILRTHFPVNPPSGHIHVLVVLPIRRINCLLPCRRDHGRTLPGFVKTVDVDSDANIAKLKEIFAKTVVGLIEDARSYYLHLFPALRGGCWLQATSSEAGDLERGDMSVLDEIVQQNQEMTALEKVSKYFPFNLADTFIHVIVMSPIRRITCVVPGIRESTFDIWIDEYADISTLKEACRQKTYLQGIPEFKLIKAQSGNSWLRSDGDDARALAIGEATERVQALVDTDRLHMQDTIQMTFGTAPFENTIHALVDVRNRRVNCLIPGRRDHGQTLPGFVMTVDVDSDANIAKLKEIIGQTGKGDLKNVRSFALHLFPALRGGCWQTGKGDLKNVRSFALHLFPALRGGCWLQATSSEAGDLERGDLSVLDEIVQQNQEMTALEKVSKYFPFNLADTFIHVIVMSPIRRITCVVPGIRESTFDIWIDEYADISTLKEACRQKTYLQGIPEFKLIKAQSGNSWLRSDGDDARALAIGEATERVQALVDTDRLHMQDTIQMTFGTAPFENTIHALVDVRNRRVNCLIPGRRDHGQTLPGFVMTVDVDSDANIAKLKEIIGQTGKGDLKNVRSFALHLFPALRGGCWQTGKGDLKNVRSFALHLFPALRGGCWLQATSSEAGDLERGDMSVLDEIVQQNQEMTALEKVSKYFPFNLADTFIHVIVMSPIRRITCVVPGIRESTFDIWIDEYADISTLKEACRQKTYLQGIPEFKLIKAQSGNSWLRSDGDDARALAIGEATERVQALVDTDRLHMQDTIQMTFGTAPFENTIHALVDVRNRRVNCLIPGRRDHGQTLPGFVMTVDVDSDANIAKLKEIIGQTGKGDLKNVRSFALHLFPALRGGCWQTGKGDLKNVRSFALHLFPALRGGCWLQATSSEAGDLERGDMSVLDEIVQQNQEMTALEKVSKYFPFNLADTFIHVIVMPPIRRITCVVPGIRESTFDIWIDEYADISTLKEACRQKTYLQGIPEFKLIKAQSGNSWLRSDGDDARALAIGEATERVQALVDTDRLHMQDTIQMTFGTAPFENTIHALVDVRNRRVNCLIPGRRDHGQTLPGFVMTVDVDSDANIAKLKEIIGQSPRLAKVTSKT